LIERSGGDLRLFGSDAVAISIVFFLISTVASFRAVAPGAL
jgi:hypothetical protein